MDDINATDEFGRTQLLRAVERGDLNTVQALVRQGAALEKRSNDGMTPLVKAAEAGENVMITTLIAAGADVDATDANGRTALMAAAQKGHAGTAAALIGLKASITATDNKADTALHYAATCIDNEQVLRLLHRKGALLNEQNAAGETPMVVAVKKHNAENVKTLLNLGASVFIADNSGLNAIEQGRALKRAKFREAMIEAFDNDPRAPEAAAMKKGTAETIKVFKPLSFRKPAPTG
ncbi:MAG: ankyrin repeat domain-containing protein [Alphaproteobacteria bacterium]